jgi:arabinogalactan oligomer/maltooligosaccharide transport system substrate-binding protein
LTAAADEVATDPIAAGFRTVGENALPMPSIPEMGAVWNYWGVTEANIISGSLAPVAGWEKMISDIQGAIAKG